MFPDFLGISYYFPRVSCQIILLHSLLFLPGRGSQGNIPLLFPRYVPDGPPNTRGPLEVLVGIFTDFSMEDYEYKVSNYMQLYPMIISKFTSKTN